MKIRNIVALGIIIGALLFWWSHAWALPAGASFTYLETWDEYGTQSSLPSIAPYVTIDPTTSSIVCGRTDVPWLHPGQNLTGCYLKMTPSGHGGENPGPTVATKVGTLGNPSQTLVSYTWFRAEVAPATSAAIFLWCDSTVAQGARGTDQTFLRIAHNGTLDIENSVPTVLATLKNPKLTFGTAVTNWYLFETIQTIGLTSSTAWQQGSITLNLYQSNGLRIGSLGCTNCVTQGITPQIKSFLIDQISYDAEFDNSVVEDFGPQWVINPGTNGTKAFVGPQYSWMTVPGGDSTPLQYAVSGVGSHFQAVSNVPPDITKYVSTATQGNKDEYTANFPFSTGTLTQQAIVSFQESDAVGVRLGTDLIVKPSGTTLTGNQCALSNGTYGFCESFYNNAVPDSQMPIRIGLELGW